MIFFVRHGQSEANLKDLFAGQRDDSLLTEKGKEQAKVTAKHIKGKLLVFDRIVSSPLKRALETADIIASELGIDLDLIQVDSRITEYDMGTLSGTPVKNISSAVLASANEAEDTEVFKKRVHSCVHDLAQLSGNTLIVSHAGVGRILEATKEGLGSKYFYDLPAWENASVTELDWIK